jgi:hypothetical protein
MTPESAAAAPVAPPETVQRWAVLLRPVTGKAELLGCIHQSADDAAAQGRYWQANYTGVPVIAEIVSFLVPLRGAPVKTSQDLLP